MFHQKKRKKETTILEPTLAIKETISLAPFQSPDWF
jgi:hypothetical protein